MKQEKVLQTSAQYIKGVGPKRYELLNRLGIETIEDLLYYLPRRYEDRRHLKPISKVTIGQVETIKGEVLALGTRKTKRGIGIFQLALGDRTGKIFATWFNQPYMKQYFKVGQSVILHGKVEKTPWLGINSPEYEILSSGKSLTIHMGRIVPIYSLTSHLSQRSIREIIKRAVDQYSHWVADMLPWDIKRRHNFLELSTAIRTIHFPRDYESCERARKRLVFDEFSLLQLIIAMRRAKAEVKVDGISHKVEGDLIERFKNLLPFQFTPAQVKAIKEIQTDMASSKPMNRLLQGEVGSGKTIVATWALILTIQSGFQGAVMVPTEILAEQHYFSLNDLLLPLGLRCEMLISSMSQSTKERIRNDLKQGEVDIVVGTHALIQESIAFKRLGLVVIDEQHKFGVVQRALLRDKGSNADVLVMTATPIPRTLALTIYGDLDITTMKELPRGRRPVHTYWVGNDRRDGVYRFIEETIKDGRQAYIVYPLVEESEKLDLKAATKMYEALQRDVFPHFEVGLIHGRMDGRAKEEIMQKFREGKIHILISTTVIEVGIDVPNASIMLIEHAERFGLSQLHQLRGRIGRGDFNSYCVLFSDVQTPEARSRLQAMVETQDGFRIAEEDLRLRGPGEFFGTRQHGLPRLRFGDMVADMELLELARAEASELIKRDPGLKNPQYQLIREALRKKFHSIDLDLMSVS